MKLGRRTFPGGSSFKSEASPERGDAAIAPGEVKIGVPKFKALGAGGQSFTLDK